MSSGGVVRGVTHKRVVDARCCFVYVKAIVKSPLGGDFVVLECKKLMEELGIEVVPPFLIADKVSSFEIWSSFFTDHTVCDASRS